MSWTYNLRSGSPNTIDGRDMLWDNGTPDVVGPWNVRGGNVIWNQDLGNADLGGRFFGPTGTYTVVTDPQCAVGGPLDYTDAMGFSILGECEAGLNAIADSSGRIVLQNPQPGRRGTLGQRTITGPRVWALDGSMSKTFRISESKQVQLRFDATNVLNHPNFNGPEFDINDDDFGTISGKGNNRRSFQGQLRFTF